ncbi:MAG: hypothetical protein KDB27_30140 [Planctomycetales bacterium]|nr:hypothetical protein [Planctomycetales bacterium]
MEKRIACLIAILVLGLVIAAPNALRSQDDIFGPPSDSPIADNDLDAIFEGATEAAVPRNEPVDLIFSDESDYPQSPLSMRPVVGDATPHAMTEHQQKWNSLREMVLKAADDETRKMHADAMKSFLEHVFDEDLARRESELGKLETRIQKLRTSVERRKSNRDRIIKVRLDALLLDAEGLGLPGLGASAFQSKTPTPKIISYTVLGQNRDGSNAVRIQYVTYKDVQRARSVAHTAFQTKPGSDQLVPVTQQRQEVYTVKTPVNVDKDVLVPAGEDVMTYLKNEIQKPETEKRNPRQTRNSRRSNRRDDVFFEDEGEPLGLEDENSR